MLIPESTRMTRVPCMELLPLPIQNRGVEVRVLCISNLPRGQTRGLEQSRTKKESRLSGWDDPTARDRNDPDILQYNKPKGLDKEKIKAENRNSQAGDSMAPTPLVNHQESNDGDMMDVNMADLGNEDDVTPIDVDNIGENGELVDDQTPGTIQN